MSLFSPYRYIQKFNSPFSFQELYQPPQPLFDRILDSPRRNIGYFSDETYGELGAMRIPANHGCFWHYIEKFSLPTRRFISYNPVAFYYWRDRKTRLDKAEALFSAYALRPEECSDPGGIYDKFLRELLETLPDREVEIFEYRFGQERDRSTIRHLSICHALDRLRRKLLAKI